MIWGLVKLKKQVKSLLPIGIPMADSSLLSLPDELQEKVVQNVARGSITDLATVKLTCKQLKEVSERPSVYRAFDLVNVPQDLLDRMPRRFFLECFRHDNPDAIYIKLWFLAVLNM
ncbi:hypothetical protein Bca101_067714 [Brassica carinata]